MGIWIQRWLTNIIPNVCLNVVKQDRKNIFEYLKKVVEEQNLSSSIRNIGTKIDLNSHRPIIEALIFSLNNTPVPIIHLGIGKSSESNENSKVEDGK